MNQPTRSTKPIDNTGKKHSQSRGERGKFRLFIIVFCIILAFGIIWSLSYSFLDAIDSRQKEAIAHLENTIVNLKESYTLFRFSILERSDSGISLKLRFEYPDGKEISSQTISIAGNEVFFDTIIYPIDGNEFIAFPYRLFSDTISAANGIKLHSLYDASDLPGIYADGSGIESSLKELFDLVKRDQPEKAPGYFGNAVHEATSFSRFTKGRIYRVIIRTKGGMEVIEE